VLGTISTDVQYARRILMMMTMKENRLLFHCVSLLLIFLEREKKEKNKEKEWNIGKKGKKHRVTGQTRCCMQCKRERASGSIQKIFNIFFLKVFTKKNLKVKNDLMHCNIIIYLYVSL